MTRRPGGGTEARGLDELARKWGVLIRHRDGFDRQVRPSPETLLQLLGELGAPVRGMSDVPGALRALEAEESSARLPPLTVVRPGEVARVPAGPGMDPQARVELRVLTEEGEVREAITRLDPRGIPLPGPLPPGYHQAQIKDGGRYQRVLVVAAPERAYQGDEGAFGGGEPAPERQEGALGAGERGRPWGLFLPLYALRTARDWGHGDLGDLEALLAWAGDRGAHAVGILPLMAAFLDEPLEPSPYAPVSRLFWNDLFLDLRRLPEWHGSPEARQRAGSDGFRDRIRGLRESREVDYRASYRLRRELLGILARQWRLGGGPEREEFRAFLRRNPEAQAYAAFQAVVEARGEDATRWPDLWMRAGIPPEAYDREDALRHLYAQFRFEEQLDALVASSEVDLYLDLPLGSHPGGFDTWSHPKLFARGASMGAPPDPFHREGQDWGLPPIRPREARRSGHAHFRRVLERLLPRAGYLRIDHVMGLHRAYWVPGGGEASEGAYVRYPADELYAILTLESHRHRTVLVGEDLGTVPPEVRECMDERGIRRMYVVPFELPDPDAGGEEGVGAQAGAPGGPLPVPRGALAGLNTHDLPPFAREWEDPAFRRRVARALERWGSPPKGAGDAEGGSGALEAREALAGILRWLGESEAGVVLASLEDLWLEREAQNVPGTPGGENWRRKARCSLEEFAGDETVLDILEELRQARCSPTRIRPLPGTGTKAGEEEPMEREEAFEGATGEEVEGNPGGPGASLLTPDDLHYFNEGTHTRLHRKLGAQLSRDPDVPGTRFAVWAPSADAVSVVGGFNGWDVEAHPLEPRGDSGIWEGFVPGVGQGALYKYRIRSPAGEDLRADPFAFRHEVPPGTASQVWDLEYEWGDQDWMGGRGERNASDAPISVYEMHLGSWKREDGEIPGYRELAPELAAYAREMGFTHVQFLPLTEHPFYGSWGYQTTGYFAPTSRYGTPQDFMYLVDHLHREGIGVFLDWVPSHFPSDPHALARFDGTHLFEHADPRQGFHPDWNSLIFNYGRNEVRSFLLSSALYWLEHYHLDGIRVDAVASMLYLDYSRGAGQWIPNRYGGRENLEAIEFLRQLNEAVYGEYPDVQMVAEESTAWPMVSRPTYVGGLGFGMKWDMGWMHDTLLYLSRDPVHRRHHHDELTFRSIYAFNENFMLPLSHDEVVHGKGSLLGRMPGDAWQKRANLRLLLAWQFLQPGKKLLFMGGEFGQEREWSHEGELDWHLLERPEHEGIRRLVGDLNRMYTATPVLHRWDFEPQGFEWVDAHDHEQSVVSFLRKGGKEEAPLLAVFHFTPVPRENHRLGVPLEGEWTEVLNSDAEAYGGSGVGNLGGVSSHPIPAHGRYHSVSLTLPPLGALVLRGPSP